MRIGALVKFLKHGKFLKMGRPLLIFAPGHVSQSDVTCTDDQEGVSVPGALDFSVAW